ncbi:hypothetical protein, unlikely [Trypanosoma brucei gambiense DAL972]|uniref:Uncharacterized protein n=1 Tax=Trypanosoma brucei gambiense (strain MHOM/CI/86/DAL972) TaxID=679716 RepID=C9ZJW8_TRYB9|nr:hypothetical protein, unlikely [Trypanosoma brucei gambiense DAL972]CBH09732.1 hypothetical protein, unlikely [Trypanosoma brucei gambiense DAL972]|eukprot:XP_011772025.1 hypothetical protein, unlikely [Trypanosoma brucei gambiense DAL972]
MYVYLYAPLHPLFACALAPTTYFSYYASNEIKDSPGDTETKGKKKNEKKEEKEATACVRGCGCVCVEVTKKNCEAKENRDTNVRERMAQHTRVKSPPQLKGKYLTDLGGNPSGRARHQLMYEVKVSKFCLSCTLSN